MTDELKVPSGVLRINRFGDPGGRLTICALGGGTKSLVITTAEGVAKGRL